jgi:hypothetical protein
MSRDLRTELSPRPLRAIDASIEALAGRAPELARRWAVALVRTRPLEEIAAISLAAVARDAPGLCAQVARALASEAELERLVATGAGGGASPGPASRLGALTAENASEAVEEVEALRGVVWEALLEELRWPSFDSTAILQLAGLSDRLAYVCATALAATLSEAPVSGGGGPDSTASAERHARAAAAREASPTAGRVVADEAERPSPMRAAVLVDEWMDSSGSRSGPSVQAERIPPSPRLKGRPRPWDVVLGDERSKGGQSRSGGRRSDR